jgi:hypothetical protein
MALILFLEAILLKRNLLRAMQMKKCRMENLQSSNETLSPMGDTTGLWEEALSPFQGTEKKGYLELVEDLKSGRVNFTWEVWALQQKMS